MDIWYYDGVWKCPSCEAVFRVQTLNEPIDVCETVCPLCGVVGIQLIPIELEDDE